MNSSNTRVSIVTIGTFDGVHIGHQKIIADIVSLAKDSGLKSTVLTLFPHPRMVLQNHGTIKLLNTIEERISILKSLGIDNVVVKEFTEEFSELSAHDYVKQILVDELKAAIVVIGYDHHFGKNRSGNINQLIQYGDTYNFQVNQIEAQQINDVSVSSTKIRLALNEGNMTKANNFLGYNYRFSGQVISGDKIGRTLGYPTANIKVNADYKLIPKDGVYLVSSTYNNTAIFGMMNIGSNPTIPTKTRSIEVHFFKFNQDIYNTSITVEILHRLRDELKFNSLDDLKRQLSKDELQAKSYISRLS